MDKNIMGLKMMDKKYSHDVFISFSFKDQAIVDKIVNQLTNVYNINCWICTEEIRAGENFRLDIAQAIKAARIVVLVQSKSSVASNEVAIEVLYALKKGKMVKPFIIEESQLSDDIEIALVSTHYIDATQPTLDERIKELAIDICRSLGTPFSENGIIKKETNETILVSTPNVIPKTIFLGRDNVLEEMHNKFTNGERVIFLYGIGGIGKTQIAKQYAKQYKNDYDTIIFATYNGSIKDLVISQSVFDIRPSFDRYIMQDGTKEDESSFFDRKLEKIKQLTNEKTLIIIDNFDVDQDDYLPRMFEGEYHLMITTRCDYSRLQHLYPTIEITAIDSIEQLQNLFLANYQGFDVRKGDSKLIELIELVNRHTYTIELLAQHMENSGQTAGEMIEALKNEGICSINESVRNEDMKMSIAYENLLKMFKIFSLKNEEQRILIYLSLMPIQGVEVSVFRRWANLKSMKIVNDLILRSWIIKNEDSIALHPIIRDVIRHKNAPDEVNCRDFLEKMADDMYNAWYNPVEQNLKIVDCVLSVAEYFIPFDFSSNDVALFDVWVKFPSFLWQVGKFQDSIRLGHIVYDTCYKKCGEASMLTGFAAKNLAGCYFNSGYIKESVEWYKIGLDFMLNSGQKECEDIALAYEKVARCYTWEFCRDIDKAKKYFNIALSIRDNLISSFISEEDCYVVEKRQKQSPEIFEVGKGQVFLEMSRMYQIINEYEIALDYAEKFREILNRLTPENLSSLAYAYFDKGVCYYNIGLNEKKKLNIDKSLENFCLAEENLNLALEINNKMRGSIAIDTIDNYEYLADTCFELGKIDEAKNYYTKIVTILEKNFAYNCKRIESIKHKINI